MDEKKLLESIGDLIDKKLDPINAKLNSLEKKQDENARTAKSTYG
jgi:hypothetical protein